MRCAKIKGARKLRVLRWLEGVTKKNRQILLFFAVVYFNT